MPELENSIHAERPVHSAAVPVVEKRFDQAHEVPRGIAKAPSPPDQSPAGVANSSNPAKEALEASELPPASLAGTKGLGSQGITPELIQQFRLQAQQLAAHLDSRQRDIDRREAELHARIAQQESAGRNARLWFQERNNELDDRKSALDQREQMINSRLIEFDERSDREHTSAEASQHDEQLLHDLDLRRRQEELNELTLQLDQRHQHCHALQQKLTERENILEAAESALARNQVEWDDQRRQEQQQRGEIQARFQEQHARAIDGHRQIEIELQKQREALYGRSQQLERRGAALDQLRSDLLRVQRETLELRLATEELWAQMSGLAPSASLTQSLARLRAQLSENFRLQAAEVDAQRTEAQQLAATVAKQHQLLIAQKHQWQQSAAAAQRQIELQAASLAAQEEQLNGQLDRQYQAQQEWEAQRHRLESELRRLQAKLRQRNAESPSAG